MGRRIAFSESERSLIIELVEVYNVVKSKKTSATVMYEKNRAWETITEVFNATGNHTQRTVIQVKTCWQNIKTKRKSEISAQEQAILSTEGGSKAKEPVVNPLINQFVDIACEISGAIDSDTISSSNVTSDECLDFNVNSIDNLFGSNNGNDAFINPILSNSTPKEVEVSKQFFEHVKSNFSSGASSHTEQNDSKKMNDEELNKLLKEELLLKIENEKELLKRRKIETEVACNDLIYRKEKYLAEMKLLNKTN